MTNNFNGPTNYVQGTNRGTMNANQSGGSATPEQLIEAMREVLNLRISWNEHGLSEVRDDISQAIEKEDPSRARAAVRKLRTTVEQLALGVGGNFAYQFLTTHLN